MKIGPIHQNSASPVRFTSPQPANRNVGTTAPISHRYRLPSRQSGRSALRDARPDRVAVMGRTSVVALQDRPICKASWQAQNAGMLAGFEQRRLEVEGATINVRVGGSGPPVLLLHGYPQTGVMWHRIAPALARTHTVGVPDLRGYGDSSKPPAGADSAEY